MVEQEHVLTVGGQHPGHLAGEQLGGEAGVVADHGAAAIPLEIPGHPLGDGADPLVGEVIGDDGAPPVGAEIDRRGHGQPLCPTPPAARALPARASHPAKAAATAAARAGACSRKRRGSMHSSSSRSSSPRSPRATSTRA